MRKNRVKQYYKESWNLIKESKWFTVFAFALFCFCFVLGFILKIYETELLEIINEMSVNFDGLNTFEIILKIFFNNSKSSFMSIIFSIGLLGSLGIFTSIFNGYLVGFVSRKSVELKGLSVLWRLIPHGIFELTAIFLSIGLSVWLAYQFIENCLKIKEKRKKLLCIIITSLLIIPLSFLTSIGNKVWGLIYSGIVILSIIFAIARCKNNKKMKKYIVSVLRTFFIIILPLLLIAACIEGILILILP